MAGPATDARKASVAAGYAAWTRVLATRAATDTGDTALSAGTATRAVELAAGSAVAVGVAATSAWILLEDDMGERRAGRRWTGRGGFRCHHRSDGNHRRNGATNDQRFHQVKFRGHGGGVPLSTHAKQSFPQTKPSKRFAAGGVGVRADRLCGARSGRRCRTDRGPWPACRRRGCRVAVPGLWLLR